MLFVKATKTKIFCKAIVLIRTQFTSLVTSQLKDHKIIRQQYSTKTSTLPY